MHVKDRGVNLGIFLIPFYLGIKGDMLGLLGAALTGAGQVAALHTVREGVGFSLFLLHLR